MRRAVAAVALTIACCALLAANAVSVSALPNCAWNGYDVSSLSADQTSAPANGMIYRGIVCGVSADAQCTKYKTGAAMCQYTASPPTPVGSLATWDGTGVWSQISASEPKLGVRVTFTNGQSQSCAAGVTTTFNFPCGDPTKPALIVTSPSACNFLATIQSRVSCTGGTSSGGGDDGGSKGLSGGSIFLIIFFVVVPVYIALGCVYKRKQMGASGVESCPNIDFWRTLPGLVADGFKFTWAKLRGLCGGGGSTAAAGTYDTL